MKSYINLSSQNTQVFVLICMNDLFDSDIVLLLYYKLYARFVHGQFV